MNSMPTPGLTLLRPDWVRRQRRKHIEALLKRFPRRADHLRLLLLHDPLVFQHVPPGEVDLTLSGHTHGGQVALPVYGAPYTLSELPRRYAKGLHFWGDHLLNVNPGIGMEGNHSPRFRLLCPPQIDLPLLETSRKCISRRRSTSDASGARNWAIDARATGSSQPSRRNSRG